MRIRTLVLAAVGLAACSAPQQTQPASRDLHLGTTATRDTGVVSEIEIGRLPKPRRPSANARRAAPAAAAALEAPAPKLALASTSAALIEPTHDFKEAAEPIEILVAGPAPAAMPDIGGIGLQRGGMGGGWSTGGRRGGVIIRGGVGGTDDDCDIRHPHSSPIAIHSLTPGFRGGIH